MNSDHEQVLSRIAAPGSGNPAYQDAVQRLKAYCEANDTPYELVPFDDPLHDECFDVDLTMLLMENTRSQGVAFINRTCFVLDPRDGLSISPEQAIAFFKAQGWIVVEVSDADRHPLALNAVFRQGKLLVTRKGLSERFPKTAGTPAPKKKEL